MSTSIFNTFWTVSEFNQDRSGVLSTLKAYGMEEMIGDLSRRASIDRAVRSLHDRRHKVGKRITERVSESVDTVTWGILEKEAGEEVNTVAYQQKTTITLRKDSGEVSVTGSLASEVLAAIEQYDNSFDDNDVRTLLRKIIRKAKGFSLRPTGGIYGVASSGLPAIQSAKNALAEIGVPAKIYIQQVYTDDGAKEIVTKSLSDEVEQRIEAVLSRVEGIRHSVRAAANQSEEIMEINELLETYKDLMSSADSYNTLSQKVMDAANTVAMAMNNLETKAVETGKGLTVGEIAEKVLTEAGKPMKAIELFTAAVAKGWIKEDDAGKRSSFNAGINAFSKSAGSRVKMVSRGTYTLNVS